MAGALNVGGQSLKYADDLTFRGIDGASTLT